MQMLNLVVAFNLGLFSTLHCLGMCGGIIGALALGSGSTGGSGRNKPYRFVIAYNAGRIISYSLAGAIAGVMAQSFVNTLPEGGHHALQIVAGLILVLIGLHLAGLFPRVRYIEAAGLKLWRLIQPLARYFIPVQTTGQALIVGMIWGWLPCALVYSTLLWSAASGDVMTGSLIMLVFGFGTLPGMITAGIAGTGVMVYLKRKDIRRWASVIIILFGLASPFLYTQHDQHEQHAEHRR